MSSSEGSGLPFGTAYLVLGTRGDSIHMPKFNKAPSINESFLLIELADTPYHILAYLPLTFKSGVILGRTPRLC